MNKKHNPCTFCGFHSQFSAVGFYNIITHRQSQPCAHAGGFGSKEWLKDLVQDSLGYPVAVIPHFDFYVVPGPVCTYGHGGFISLRVQLPLLGYRIERIVEQVKDDPSYFIGYNPDVSD